MVRDISNKNLPIIVAESGLDLEYTGDNTRLKEEINKLKFTPIKNSIEKLYGYYLENKDIINRELLTTDK